jgi:hypothetical protein
MRFLSIGVLIAFGSSLLLSYAQTPKPLSLKDQLEAQYAPETVLVIQKEGLLGVAPIILKNCIAKYQSGALKAPEPSCYASFRDSSRILPPGERVNPKEIRVNLQQEIISLLVVECDACNKGISSTSYKAEVEFQFAKGFLERGNVSQIEDTIGQLLMIGGGDEAQSQSSQGASNLLTNDDILKMANAKLGEGIIMSTIKTEPCCSFDTTVNGMIKLRNAGVSDAVIQAMRDAQTGNAAPNDQSATSNVQGQIQNAGGDSPEQAVQPDNADNVVTLSPAYWDGQLSLNHSLTFPVRENCGRPHQCAEGSLIITPASIKYISGGATPLDAPISAVFFFTPRGRCQVGLEVNGKKWQFFTVVPPGYICETASRYLSGLIPRLISSSAPSAPK